jgi:hypothetical protein
MKLTQTQDIFSNSSKQQEINKIRETSKNSIFSNFLNSCVEVFIFVQRCDAMDE